MTTTDLIAEHLRRFHEQISIEIDEKITAALKPRFKTPPMPQPKNKIEAKCRWCELGVTHISNHGR